MSLFSRTRATRHGFSLMELMVVLAIILFLTQLLVPKVMGYLSRARTTEVSVNLSSLYTAQCAHQMAHGTFSSNLQTIGWQPNGYHTDAKKRKNYYTYGCPGAESQEGVQVFTGSAGAPASKLGRCAVDGTHFEARAVLVKDGKTQRWRITESGVIEALTQ